MRQPLTRSPVNRSNDWLEHELPPVAGQAPGGPGIAPRWTHANKQGIGTACSASSRVWYTLWNGHLTELYFPTLDRPQMRDLQLLITDGATFFHDETHRAGAAVRRLDPALGYEVRREYPGQYRLEKTILGDPRLPCVVQRCRIEPDARLERPLAVYVLVAPHLEVGGWGNHARVVDVAGTRLLTAHKDGVHLAVGVSLGFVRASAGYVGVNDGWTDLHENYQLDENFAEAVDGNVALCGEVNPRAAEDFCVGVAFGTTCRAAMTGVLQSLEVPFAEIRERFEEQWREATGRRRPLDHHSGDRGDLARSSYSLLLAYEDKTYHGGMVASLAIPWGEAKADQGGLGGYHLVWTRDMVQSATGLLAAGNVEIPRRALLYLACCQEDDGNFAQNFWLDGTSHWTNMQLDQVAQPIILARRLHHQGVIRNFHPWPVVRRGIRFLLLAGPVTEQERWEELSGYSPSTLATVVPAALAAGAFLEETGDTDSARFVEGYADWVCENLRHWTVTHTGSLSDSGAPYFVRLLPADRGEAKGAGEIETAEIEIPNQPPGHRSRFPAKEIVDGGFLLLVRYGVMAADDPLIKTSVRVIDRELKVELPAGPVWKRFSHDGFGQRDDGSAYQGWGRGRPWPLLVGERAIYEIAAGGDARPLVRTIENLATGTGMLPEQVWDGPPIESAHLHPGGPTGAVMPLAWAHAEYLNALRSLEDGSPYDRLPEARRRYIDRSPPPAPTYWTFHHPTATTPPGRPIRIYAGSPFRLLCSRDGWKTREERASKRLAIDVHVVELPPLEPTDEALRFSFPDRRDEPREHVLRVEPDSP